MGALVACGVTSATAATRQPAVPAASADSAPGLEAALPANAVPARQDVEVDAVSCPSAGNCGAVGSYSDNSGDGGALLLTEKAGSWETGTEAVVPANARPNTLAALSSISCASAGNCSAVGTYIDSSESWEGLLLTETGGSWGPGVEAALPADAGAPQQVVISSLSCSSAGNCSAVGSYQDDSGNTQGLLLTETGGSWATGVEAVLPAGAVTIDQEVDLNSVSCASAGNCSAVGSYQDSSGMEALVLDETGGSWSAGAKATLPADAVPGSNDLWSVSCASDGNCSAIGSYADSSGTEGLLLDEKAGSWSTGVKAALPTGVAFSPTSFPSVSCVSAGNCTAVANSTKGGLLLTETSGNWATAEVAPLPADGQPGLSNELTAVSCSSVGNCGAVGTFVLGDTHGLLLTETAGSWTAIDVTPPANAASIQLVELHSVSCPSVGSCSAVGDYIEGTTQYPEGLLLGGSPPRIELDISKSGTGAGTVKSSAEGLDCGSTCSAMFDSGSVLTLTANPSPGSRFQGWSGGGCSGTGRCHVNTGISAQTVTATFALLPKCVVPRLKDKTLRAAKSAIRSGRCNLGNVTHADSRRVERGHVISQRPRPGRQLRHGAKINLLVSKGR